MNEEKTNFTPTEKWIQSARNHIFDEFTESSEDNSSLIDTYIITIESAKNLTLTFSEVFCMLK